ncbi:unnamed protein product [Cuscuta campestris]|uniref:Uncharacterized protein n=1 Tax=Cuscuta campestris TaxID=132261 RepID=A0A484MMF9_9ASTE|nr:unnamed protein product [Cuscuta campestris]
MEALISQFEILSDRALCDKSFDPHAIEDVMKLFELDAYKAWAASELEQDEQVIEAETHMDKAEDHLHSVMDSAMEELRRFEEEMDRMAQAELESLVGAAEEARTAGKTAEMAAAASARKYIESAVSSAAASMRSAVKAVSSHSKKVHPS